MSDTIGGRASEVPFQFHNENQECFFLRINYLHFLDKPLLRRVPLKEWVVIVPSRDAVAVDKLISTMRRVAGPLRLQISDPMAL